MPPNLDLGDPSVGLLKIPARGWDERVDSWDEVAKSPAFRRLAHQVIELAGPLPNDVVIDLGSGTGLLTLALADSVHSVTAVDSSPAMLERLSEKAERAGVSNVRTLVGDLRSLPLADESATLAVSNYAFHHLHHVGKELALSEVRRVLAPGGRLVLCDMMFTLSLRSRDRRLLLEKALLIARRGPAGFVRISKNVGRIMTRTWEHPAPEERWVRMLSDRHFTNVSIALLEHEAGVVYAQRPFLRSRRLSAR